jgi:hypothetical protein
MTELKYKDVTDGIINAFYHVNNTLGHGFLEKVYENALSYELRQRGYEVLTQQPITVWYKRGGGWRVLCRFSYQPMRNRRTQVRCLFDASA